LEILANGFIDHEAAHLRYTDFTVSARPGLAKLLTNLLEDIRIEQALGVDYPGSRHNLGGAGGLPGTTPGRVRHAYVGTTGRGSGFVHAASTAARPRVAAGFCWCRRPMRWKRGWTRCSRKGW
jgi:hypothetical protein